MTTTNGNSQPTGYPIPTSNTKWSVRYFTPDQSLQDFRPHELDAFDQREDLLLQHHPRMRRILRSLGRRHDWYYSLLHWSDGTDLSQIDRRVTRGDVTVDDFAGAIVVVPDLIGCRSCSVRLRVAEYQDGAAIFGGSSIENLERHRFLDRCPVCGQLVGSIVAEFLDEPPCSERSIPMLHSDP